MRHDPRSVARLASLLVAVCACTPAVDTDKDGLSDVDEAKLGADPKKPDTDKDGLKDGIEAKIGTDPTKRDSDGDGLSDAEEQARGTDPRRAELPRGPSAGEWLLPANKPLPDPFRCGAPGALSTCFLPVPGGSFLMGAQASDPAAPGYDPAARPDEGPPHEVTLPPFWILKYEAQSDQVELCVSKGWCRAEDYATGGYMNYGSGRRNQPANGASWDGAARFCQWMGARLPTEAEWELAARGTGGARFPWGDMPQCGVALEDASAMGPDFRKKDDVPDATCVLDGTAATGRLRGPSPYGVYGMAGNVWEWVADYYAADAYAAHVSPAPTGPPEGAARVQRGGGWTSTDPLELRSAARGSLRPDQKLNDVGFRCVRNDMGEPR